MKSSIAVIGTGYVGLVSAVCFADEGKRVVCVDTNEGKIENLKKGIMPIYEAGLEELCHKNHQAGTIDFTTDVAAAIQACEYIMIAVGTPGLENGDVDMSAVFAVARSIGENINGYKVVIDKSTVPVGTQEEVARIIRSLAPQADFDVVSNPEFLREGTAVYDVQHTDRIIIGADSPRAIQKMMELYDHSESYKMVTTPKSAEMIKYAANSFLSCKISFINEIANLCDLVGADVCEVSDGMMRDRRIAPYFLQAGIGFGGGCFPKDTKALSRLAEQNGYEFKVLDAAIAVNNRQKYFVVDKVVRALKDELDGKQVAVWGLSFKPGTSDVRGSIGIEIVAELRRKGLGIVAYDPKAMEDAKRVMAASELAPDMYAALHGADLLLVLTEWPVFVEADFDKVKTLLKNPIVVDGRNCLDKKSVVDKGFRYMGVGH